jgi:hypothetical protein
MTGNKVLWGTTLCSLLEVNRRFGGTCRLHLQGGSVNQAKIQHEAGFQRTTQCYNSEDRSAYNRRCENLKTYMIFVLLCTGVELGVYEEKDKN